VHHLPKGTPPIKGTYRPVVGEPRGGKKAEPWSPSPASPDASGSPPLREHRPPDEALLTPRSLGGFSQRDPSPFFRGKGCGDGARSASFFLFSFREEENTSLYEEFRGGRGGSGSPSVLTYPLPPIPHIPRLRTCGTPKGGEPLRRIKTHRWGGKNLRRGALIGIDSVEALLPRRGRVCVRPSGLCPSLRREVGGGVHPLRRSPSEALLIAPAKHGTGSKAAMII
jgi:hypothetical protein